MKTVVTGLLIVALGGAAGAQSCGEARRAGKFDAAPANAGGGASQPEAKSAGPTVTPEPEAAPADLRVLAEGQQGKADRAFVAVVRDPESYAALGGLAGKLPQINAELFKSHAVVAAFLGYRESGGYGVTLTRTGGGALRVVEKSPPKGAYTTAVITNPFLIVAAPEDEQSPVWLELTDAWAGGSLFQVVEGEFTMNGGLAGRAEKFKLAGEIQMTGHGSLKTFYLNLKGVGASKPRALRTIATGLIGATGAYRVARLNAGTLVESPNGGLTATAELRNKNTELSVTFAPVLPNAADGFGGAGGLKAEPSRRRSP